jgi:uncharacterized protein (TIGR02597 family)
MKVTAALLFLFGSATTWATTATTPPAGYFKLSAPAGSDTRLALPLLTRSERLGRVMNVTADSVLLDLPGIVDGQFAPTAVSSYYLQIKSGNLAGLMFRIISSTGNQVRLDTRGANLMDHPLGTLEMGIGGALACIRKFATIKDVLGDGTSLALVPVTSLTTGAYQEGDAIFVPSASGKIEVGQPRISYLSNAGWRQSGDIINDAGNTALVPGFAFTVRTAVTRGAEFFVFGYVPYGKFAVELPATTAGEVADVHVALISAQEVALQTSGLLTDVPTWTPLRTSLDGGILADVLLSWTDARVGMDRPPAGRYYAIGQDWYRAGSVVNAESLAPGAGYVLRMREGRDKRFWFQNSTY